MLKSLTICVGSFGNEEVGIGICSNQPNDQVDADPYRHFSIESVIVLRSLVEPSRVAKTCLKGS